MSSSDRTAVLKRSAIFTTRGEWESPVNAASSVTTNLAYKTIQVTPSFNEDVEPVPPRRSHITLPAHDLATLAPTPGAGYR